jgi:hypothetical protein
VALMLKEVQMPIFLGDRVLRRMQALMTWQRKPGARSEVNQHHQALHWQIELNRLDRRLRADSKRRLEQLVVRNACSIVRMKSSMCRIRPPLAYRRPGGVKGSLCRATPALDPFQAPHSWSALPFDF